MIGALPFDPKGFLQVFDLKESISDSFYWDVSEAEAQRYAWYQGVAGDSTDGVKGCPGIGPVKALKFANSLNLSKPLDCWKETVSLFQKAKVSMPENEALLQARLTRVLQPNQYNFETHKVTLWTPPTTN
jgi:DNA polymerase-1